MFSKIQLVVGCLSCFVVVALLPLFVVVVFLLLLFCFVVVFPLLLSSAAAYHDFLSLWVSVGFFFNLN